MAHFWRVFPWDLDVNEGSLFSPSHIPPTTGRGRFDLPLACSPVLYVAESPEHAIAEAIQPWRNHPVRRPHLLRAGRPLALVGMQMAPVTASHLADLCQPAVLSGLGLSADRVASRHRRRTQAIAASVWDRGHAGLRWWSSFRGDWHGIVLFTARLKGRVRFGSPEVLSAGSPALQEAAAALGMRVAI